VFLLVRGGLPRIPVEAQLSRPLHRSYS
jgi:hypothetical protein